MGVGYGKSELGSINGRRALWGWGYAVKIDSRVPYSYTEDGLKPPPSLFYPSNSSSIQFQFRLKISRRKKLLIKGCYGTV